jgi:hypothetical protein
LQCRPFFSFGQGGGVDPDCTCFVTGFKAPTGAFGAGFRLPTGAIGVFVGATVIGCVVGGGVGVTTEVNVGVAVVAGLSVPTGAVVAGVVVAGGVVGVVVVGLVVAEFTGLSVPTGAVVAVPLVAVNPPTGAVGASFGFKTPIGLVGFGVMSPTGAVGFLGTGLGGGGGANSFLIAAVVAPVRVLETMLPIAVCFTGGVVGEAPVGVAGIFSSPFFTGALFISDPTIGV